MKVPRVMKISSTGDSPSNFFPSEEGGEWITEEQGIDFIAKKQLKMK